MMQEPDPLLTAPAAAEVVGISLAGLWRGVATGRFPAPVYPAARAPRWRRSELLAALEATRAIPRDQMALRRAAKLRAGDSIEESLAKLHPKHATAVHAADLRRLQQREAHLLRLFSAASAALSLMERINREPATLGLFSHVISDLREAMKE